MSGSAKKGAADAVRKSLVVTVLEAKGLNIKSGDKASVYCVVSVNNVHFNTTVSDKGQKPEWKQKFTFTEAAIQPKDAQLRVIVFHKNGPKDTVIGEADLLLSDLTPNSSWKEWHSLGDEKSKGKICLDINLVTDAPTSQKRKNRMNESLTRRISWGAKQTSTAAIVSSPNKKAERREDTTTSDDEDLQNDRTNGDKDKSGASGEAGSQRKRRESVFDFVGNGTDVENYEEGLQVAYQDETDMEDAFGGAEDEDKHEPADQTDEGTDFAEKSSAPPSAMMPAPVDDSGTDHAPASHTEAIPTADSDTHEATPATTDDVSIPADSPPETPSKITISKKDKKGKKRGHRNKEKPLESVAETDEESAASDDISQTKGVTSSPAVLATSSEGSDSPSRKKSMNPFRGLLKRLTTKSVSKSSNTVASPSGAPASTSDASSSAAVAESSSPANAPPSTGPTTVGEDNKTSDPSKSPRAKSSKHDVYEPMRAELRTYIATEKTYLHNIQLLLDEWLLPAKRATVPIEHIAALVPAVEQMITGHSDVLRAVEKRLKDDHLPVGTLFDDLLAEVSNAYKTYRSKQVLLLSLLDSSPTEKSMADHAAISNWLTTRADGLVEAGKDVAPLPDLIMEPMHHLSGLAYMLERLSEVVPKLHPDLPNVRKAAARVHLLHTEISARGTTYRSMAKLSEIDSMLEFPPGMPTLTLADESAKRSYLLEGGLFQLEQLSSERSELRKIHLFLFNDLVLLCQEIARDATAAATATAPKKSTSIRDMIARRTSTGPKDASAVVSPTTNAGGRKYLVVSRLKLDRIFLVDPQDTHDELTTFTNARAAAKANPQPSKGVEVIEDGVEELAEYESLLELVDMGVGIHRWRFSSADDKRLWLDTFNGALASVKPAFNVNERKYLYKLLLTHDIPPFATTPAGDVLATWPTVRFLASVASRQLVERMHSTSFATANMRSSQSGGTAATESEMIVIKQEVAILKREHQRQLNELNTRHEVDQAEIQNLHKQLAEKDSSVSVVAATSDEKGSSKKKKRGAEVVQAEARAEEFRVKYVELMATMNGKEKREDALLQRLEAAETAMKEQNAQFSQTVAALNASLESNRQEMSEMQAVRKQMLQQQQMLQGLLEQMLTVSFKSEKPPIVAPQGNLPRRDSLGAGAKASAPAKGTGAPNVPSKPVVTPGPSWRGSLPAQNSASHGTAHAASPGSLPASAIPGANEKPIPNPAVYSIAARGKRASSQTLVAQPVVEGETVADSSESSNSAPRSQQGGGSTPAPAVGTLPSTGSSPSLFGTSGKSPSRLNLNASQNAQQNGTQPPLSPSSAGRGKERKLKNVVYKNGEESSKPGWMRKLMGSPKPRRDEASGQPAAPWRQPPGASGQAQTSPANGSDSGGVTIKKQNKVDWSQTRAEAYFSDDMGSDYDPAMHLSPSDFERLQDAQMAPDGDNSDYYDENAH